MRPSNTPTQKWVPPPDREPQQPSEPTDPITPTDPNGKECTCNIDTIVEQVLAKIKLPQPPAGQDGQAGQDGSDGRGIVSVTAGDNGYLVIRYSDDTTQEIGPLGIGVEMYDVDGEQVDSEWVPINGVLRLKKYYRQNKG